MNLITEHFNKDNLHHAYLIEGARDVIISEISVFINSMGIQVLNNPDFCHISMDNFKIDDAFNLRQMGSEKSFTTSKKFFLVSANSFTLDSQQALLKMFEEPIEDTHFFVIVPEVDALIKTLISRFYLIRNNDKGLDIKYAEQFIKMPLPKRIDFIKELLAGDEDMVALDSARSKSLKFLNALESVLHSKLVSKTVFDTGFFNQIFKVREFLRQPGSATKTLMESVALSVPVL